jgi:hypothetical protein
LPGETVSFKPTTLPEAQAILKAQCEELDVGPVTRQFLTRADDLFGDLVHLALHDKLIRRQVTE